MERKRGSSKTEKSLQLVSSLPWQDRINATIRNAGYQKDAVGFLLFCQKEVRKFPKGEREIKWITHFIWDHQNPVAKKWGMPWFIDPFDPAQVNLSLLATQERRAKHGASLSTPKVMGIKKRRLLILEVDLPERKKDIMRSLGATLTNYRKHFRFHHQSPPNRPFRRNPKVITVKAKRFLILEIDLAAPHKGTTAILDTVIGDYRKKLHFHQNKTDPRKESTRADPWEIWDQIHIHKRNLNAIAKERAGSSKDPAYDPKVAKEYQVVRNALHQAENMILQIGRA